MKSFELFLVYFLILACAINFVNILLEKFAFGAIQNQVSKFHETVSFYNWTQSSKIAATLLPFSQRLSSYLNIETNVFRKDEWLCFREFSSYEFENNCKISFSKCYIQNNSTAQYIQIRQHSSYTRYEKTKWIAAGNFNTTNKSTLSEDLKVILYTTDDYSKMEWNGCNCYHILTGNGFNKFEANFCNEYGLNITRSLIMSSDDKEKYINDFDVCDGKICSKVEMVHYLNKYIFSKTNIKF